MAHLDIIRAWKDEEYRLSLSEAERAHLLENPAGSLELTDAALELVGGGSSNGGGCVGTVVCKPIWTWFPIFVECTPCPTCK